MADIILHHYPTSPFAEKIRLVLGFKQLAWKSVIIPAIMPKTGAWLSVVNNQDMTCADLPDDAF
jgi:glutathione S-transferase